MAHKKEIRLATEEDLASAVRELSKQCKVMRAVAKRTGLPPLRDYPGNFKGLARIVTGQQVSAASAAAIWKRVEAGIRPFEAGRLLAIDDAGLKSFGLSAGKIRTLRLLAEAVTRGSLDFARLNRTSNDAIRETLTALHGIGPWTADIYLLFCLRRSDAFAAGDLALQVAAQRAFARPERLSAEELLELAETWRPWRAAAARLLWADYALIRTPKPNPGRKKAAQRA